MKANFFINALHGIHVNDVWLQKDVVYYVIVCLLRLISRNGDLNWSPISHDLTPLSNFLKGAVKKNDMPTN